MCVGPHPLNPDSNQVEGLGQILGQGPQRQPDASLSLGPLLMPQLVKRKKKKRRTRMKMRKRKWQLGGCPPDGVSWELPSGLALPALLIERPAPSAAAEP